MDERVTKLSLMFRNVGSPCLPSPELVGVADDWQSKEIFESALHLVAELSPIGDLLVQLTRRVSEGPGSTLP
jgi:hypothetical protein